MNLEEKFLDASFEPGDLSFKSGDPSQGVVEFTTRLEALGAVGGWSRIQRDHRI